MEAGRGQAATRGAYATTVTTLPALAAIVLGLLYAIGALVRTAELRGAGMTVRDTITLLPVDQHLARGIDVVLSPRTLFFVGASVAVGLVFHQTLRRNPPDRGQEVTRRRRILLYAIAGFLVVGALILQPLSFIAVMLGMILAIALLALVGNRFLAQPPAPTPLAAIAAVLLSLGTFAVFSALIDPEPLPRAALTAGGGKVIHGSLVAVANGSWYLDVGKDRIVAIPTSRVDSSQLRSRDRPDDERRMYQSLPTLLWGD